ncbi:MAG: hypothetical protein FOGNACKC_04262 [Anaerolineae bacterium]|nr:hypothetical protein [Anaerolineae bacterium]
MRKKNLKLATRPEPQPPAAPELSPPEAAEMLRFKELTLSRAGKRAAVQRLIARLQREDELSNAA